MLRKLSAALNGFLSDPYVTGSLGLYLLVMSMQQLRARVAEVQAEINEVLVHAAAAAAAPATEASAKASTSPAPPSPTAAFLNGEDLHP